MITTITPNPSIDRTVTLDEPLTPGEVHRISSTLVQGGGKGVNVAVALTLADIETWALFPAQENDPLVQLVRSRGVPHGFAPIQGFCRTNLTIVSRDVTTKINEPGPRLSQFDQDTFTKIVHGQAEDTDWVVVCGTVSPALPGNWLARALVAWRDFGTTKVAIDSSGPWLRSVIEGLDHVRPDLVAPNVTELAELGMTAQQLIDLGVGEVLLTKGAEGAELWTANGVWRQAAFRVIPNCTVGAGDAALAGYLVGYENGLAEADRLRLAVAYGSTAVTLPGSTMPSAAQVFAATGVGW